MEGDAAGAVPRRRPAGRRPPGPGSDDEDGGAEAAEGAPGPCAAPRRALGLEEEQQVSVSVLSVAGDCLTSLRVPLSATARTLKVHIQDVRAIPIVTQKLVFEMAILGDDVPLGSVMARRTPSVTVTLVVVSYNPEMGVPLLNSAEDGDLRGAERALQALADPNYSDADGWTPMHMASLNGHAEVVRLLVEACADRNKTAQDGGTPLHMASWSGHVEVVRLLCEAGADKDRPQHNGWTALHVASRNGDLEVVRLLCEAGVNTDQPLVDGRKALHIALFNGHFDVVGVIQKHNQETRELPPSRLGALLGLLLRLLQQLKCRGRRPPGAAADKDK